MQHEADALKAFEHKRHCGNGGVEWVNVGAEEVIECLTNDWHRKPDHLEAPQKAADWPKLWLVPGFALGPS